MLAYAVRRIVASVPVLAIVAVAIFFLIHLTPGDAADALSSQDATAEEIERLRRSLGLDAPIYVQFWNWISGVIRGDLGYSLFLNTPVATLIWQRIAPTLALSLFTIVFAVAVGIPLGLVAAWKANSIVDRLIMIAAVIGFSIPGFWLGLMLIFNLSVNLGAFPVQGFVPLSEDPVAFAHHLVLPSLTVGTVYMALLARITRATVIEILSEDYIRTAYAKGVPPLRILLRHALRNAGVPIITIVGIGFALLINGVVVVETVFNIPGIGSLTIEALLNRDYPVIQGVLLVFSFVYVLINLSVDLSYSLFDPRVRR